MINGMDSNSFKGKFAAVLPAGGLGKRMGGNIPKQLMEMGGKPVYRYSLETFLHMDEFAEVVMAVPADWKDHFEKDFSHPKLKIVVGGAERWQSLMVSWSWPPMAPTTLLSVSFAAM